MASINNSPAMIVCVCDNLIGMMYEAVRAANTGNMKKQLLMQIPYK